MSYSGTSRQALEYRFWARLADAGDTFDFVHRKHDWLVHPGSYIFCDSREEDQMPLTFASDSLFSL
jgi:hypothetical protein